MLLYIHVPFCRSKCRYCAFFSQTMTMDALDLYLKGLAAEAARFGRNAGKPEVETVFIGGGTPTILPEWALDQLFTLIRDNFRLASGAEFSMEANPDSVDSHKLRLLRAGGVNRLSLGVQSLEDETLKVLGRPHTASQARAAFEAARMSGFGNISVDLMWGLPAMRFVNWRRQLKEVVEKLKPEHISAYGLTLEEGTPLAHSVSSGHIELPDDDEQGRMFVHGSRFLEERGYLHYEISNFARMGFFCRHNLGYWEGADYLGLGPSAVSTMEGRRWENPRDFNEYARAAAMGETGKQAELLDATTRARELVMLSLRTSRGLSRKQYQELTGESFTLRHKGILSLLQKHELVRVTRDYVRLTKNGMLVSNVILEKLMFDDDTDEVPGTDGAGEDI